MSTAKNSILTPTAPAPVQKPQIVRCAVYTRVSTDEQTKRDYNSLETQHDICKHAIAVKHPEGWREGDYFEDAGYSGKDLERPAVQRLMAAARAGTIDAIIVYKLDRLTRSISDFYGLWEVLKEHEVVFVSATQAFDTSDPIGNLMLNMLLSFGQFERELISERVKHKSLERAKRGLWHGGWIPTGYTYCKTTKMLLPCEVEAPMVKRIFSLAKDLKSPGAVADALNELGLVSRKRKVVRRSGEEQMVGGNRWIGDRVTKVVSNPIYRGMIVHQDAEYKGVHKALVSEALWAQANDALASVDAPARPHAMRNKYDLLLKGVLRCDHCGNLMTPKPSGKKDPDGVPYLYYCCGDVNRNGLASKCGLRNIGSKPFEKFVIKVIGEIGRHPDVIKATLAASKIRGNKAIRPLQKKIRAAEKGLKEIEGQIRSCVEMVKKMGADNVGDDFVAETKALGDQKQKAEVEIETFKMDLQRMEKLVVTEAHVSDALLQFEKVFGTLDFDEQRELIELLIREIRVSKTHPDLEGKDVDPRVFTTKIRTSWYRVSFQFYVDPLFSRDSDASMKSSHLDRSGYPARTRTLND